MRRLLPVFLLLIPLSLSAETPVSSEAPPAGAALQLPDDIRVLLNQEMQAIRKGMEALVFDVASGNWEAIRKTGDDIRSSYIMAQRLNEHQRHQLHEALPDGFKQLDNKFHHYAGMLSHVAEERDIELVHFYVYKMNEACTSCHARFAQDRFKAFAAPNRHERHSH